MSNPIIVIHNAETDEIIEREMNANELKQYEIDKMNAALKAEAEVEAKANRAAAEAKLAALGLSVEDLKALGLG